MFKNPHVQNQEALTQQVFEYYNNKKDDRNLQQALENDGFVHHHFGLGPTEIDIKTATEKQKTAEVQRQDPKMTDELIRLLDINSEEDNYILDIACGRGGNMFRIAEDIQNSKLEGINICDYHIDFINKSIDDRSLKNRMNATLGNFMEMPYENNSFTHAFSSEVTEYAYSLDEMFSEVNRVLKPNGTFVILTWNYNEQMPRDELRTIIEPINDHYASTMHSNQMYLDALNNNGFEILEDIDRSKDLIPYWELRQEWELKSGIEPNFIVGHRDNYLFYKLFKAVKR